MYLLKVTKFNKNVQYKAQVSNQYDYRAPYEMNEYDVERKLEVEVTDEEFQSIKKAVLEVM